MTAPLDFSTVTDAMPAFAFGLASRIGYEAFGVLPADMAGKSLGLDCVRELLALRDAAIRNEATKGMGKKAAQQHMARIHRIADAHGVSADYIARVAHGKGV